MLAIDGLGVETPSINVHEVLSRANAHTYETVVDTWRGSGSGHPSDLAKQILIRTAGTSTLGFLAATTKVPAQVVECLVAEKLPRIQDRVFSGSNIIGGGGGGGGIGHECPCHSSGVFRHASASIVVINDFDTAAAAAVAAAFKVPDGHVAIRRVVIVPIHIAAHPVGMLTLANAVEPYTYDDIVRIVEVCYVLWPYVAERLTSLHTQQQLSDERSMSHKQIESVRQLNDAKDTFFATLSHELRTPLNGIVVMTRMLREERESLTPKLQGFIDILSKCSLQMLEWINDILDYSKLASSRFALNTSNVCFDTLIDESLVIGNSLAQGKNLKIRRAIGAGAGATPLPKYLKADAKRVQQILVNLLSNAVKFTDVGDIVVVVNAHKQSTNNVIEDNVIEDNGDGKTVAAETAPSLSLRDTWLVEIRVVDNGCGIGVDDRDRVFEVFSHAESAPVDMVYRQGSGLGLAIARNLARLMGGDICIEANPQRGSTFVVTLLMREEMDISALLDMYRDRMRGRRVMIVDDKEDNRIYLANLAFQWLLVPTICSSATEALVFAGASCFDIFWIDIQMAGLNGIELAQRLRQMYSQNTAGAGADAAPTARAPLIIGLSSIGSELHGKQVFDIFETKPVDQYSLLANTVKLLFDSPRPKSPTAIGVAAAAVTKPPKRKRRHSVHGGVAVTEAAAAAASSSSASVSASVGASARVFKKPFLVYAVEDDMCNRVILSTLVTQIRDCNNIVLEMFETGEDMMRRVVERMPHACLIDLKLRTMSGYDVVQKIREQCHRTNKSLPTMIAVTASVLESDRQQCSLFGFDYYVGKPIDVTYFWSIITTISQKSSSKPAPTPTSLASSSSSSSSKSSIYSKSASTVTKSSTRSLPSSPPPPSPPSSL